MPPELYKYTKLAVSFLGKHSVVFYLSFIMLALAGAIYVMYTIVQTTFNPPVSSASSIQSFDDKTVQKIKDLRDSNNGVTTANFPCPRLNPFAEGNLHCIYLIGAQLEIYRSVNKDETPSADTLCTFVKTYLSGTDCKTVSQNFTDDQGKSFTVQYHYVPKATNEIGYWDSYVCSSKSPNGIATTNDSSRFALIARLSDQSILCADN